ncbi:hypothetical protein L3X38_045450 [Prunus dulcis]|uniref:Uncharacterized protein n=1 Tax=Prunus dulcis TaxID=3755 RepID=A0AAD4V0L4_PRUDU|nr:hypothetical protein L3X38_045450 [Prunus dulcis]
MAENNNNNNALEGPQNDEDNHSVHNDENRSVHNDENRSVHNDENPLVKTLHDYLHPAHRSVPSCIIFPLNGQTFDFKPGMVQLLPTFHGMESENPYSHLREFEEVCGTFPTQGNGLINCRNGLMQLSFGNMTLELNILNICKQPANSEDVDKEVYMIETIVQNCFNSFFLVQEHNGWIPKYEELPTTSDEINDQEKNPQNVN